MPDQSCATLLKASVTGQSRSSSASTLRKASKSFPEDGSSSAPSHGSTAAGDWPKIGKNPSQVHRHGYSLHISEPSRVKLQGIVIMRRVLNQTLSEASNFRLMASNEGCNCSVERALIIGAVMAGFCATQATARVAAAMPVSFANETSFVAA